MTYSRFTIDADALHAYADGRLGAAERAAVERHLAANPEAAAEIAGWVRQNEALTALFPPMSGEAVPARLAPQAIARDLRNTRQQGWRNIAAALLLVTLGTSMGWLGRDYLAPTQAASERLIDAAVTAHQLYVREKTRAVEVAADAPNLMTWLSSRITVAIDAPDLSGDGYAFLGGRLLPGAPDGALPAPAALLMYENAAAQRVTLYITSALPDRTESWAFETRGGVEAYYWANDLVTCTVVADVSEDELRRLGRKIFEQLTRRPDTAQQSW